VTQAVNFTGYRLIRRTLYLTQKSFLSQCISQYFWRMVPKVRWNFTLTFLISLYVHDCQSKHKHNLWNKVGNFNSNFLGKWRQSTRLKFVKHESPFSTRESYPKFCSGENHRNWSEGKGPTEIGRSAETWLTDQFQTLYVYTEIAIFHHVSTMLGMSRDSSNNIVVRWITCSSGESRSVPKGLIYIEVNGDIIQQETSMHKFCFETISLVNIQHPLHC